MGIRYANLIGLFATACLAVGATVAGKSLAFSLVPFIAGDQLRLDFGFSALSVPFLLIIAIVAPAVGLWGLKRGRPRDGVRLIAFLVAMMAVLFAQSVTSFALSWELMTLVSVVLVGAYHELRTVQRALFSYMIVSQIGALSIVAALVLLGVHAHSFRFADIATSATALHTPLRFAVFSLALIGFGSKAGLVPLHFWLPGAHPVAPANASALLSGVMLKIAIYGLLLTFFLLDGPLPAPWGLAVLVIGALTAAIGALYAAVENDLKRLLAYSSIENIGIIVTAMGMGITATALELPTLAALALFAALFHSINHGVFKSLLFLGSGTVADTARSVDLDRLGGLGRVLRFSSPMMFLGCMAVAALPPLNGFSSEWLVFRSLIAGLPVLPDIEKAFAIAATAALGLSSALGLAAFVKLYGMTFLGRARAGTAEVESIDGSNLALALLAATCVVLGCAPLLALGGLSSAVFLATGEGSIDAPSLPQLPWLLGALPLLAGAAVYLLSRLRPVRSVPTWTCGSPVTTASQYTSTAYANPLRSIFGFLLLPQPNRVVEYGASRWVPTRIRYSVSTRYIVDEASRTIAAAVQTLARKTRIVQSGFLRVYLAYALAAVAVALVAAR